MVFLACILVLLITTGIKSECVVNDIPTQENFNFEKFMGLWYEISWYSSEKLDPSLWMSDKIHHAIQTDENSATFYTRGRTPGASSCEHGVYQVTKQGNTAKLQMTSSGSSTPYWVLDTDYTDYALVYGCYDVSNSGSCRGARAWVLSRSKSLSETAQDKTAAFYQNICVQESEFETVAFENTCDIKPHVNLDPDNQCLVKDLQPQSNFDIAKFAGKWYEIKYMVNAPIAQEHALWDMVHFFNYDGNMNVTDNVYFRTKETTEACLNVVFKWKKTSTPGSYLENDKNHMVLETDYSQYALLYKCIELEADGRCKQAASRILSRTQDLPASLEQHLHRTLQGMCVNPSVYLTSYQENVCEYKTHMKPRSEGECLVKDLKPQRDFDMNKFAGRWYEMKYMVNQHISQKYALLDMSHYFNFDSNMDVTDNMYFRTKETNACMNAILQWGKTSTPGVYMEANSSMLVIETDYSQYALLYKCIEENADGRCTWAASRIFSRTPDLPVSLEEKIFGTLQDMCVNPAVYLTSPQKNECDFKTHVKPSSESECLVNDLQPHNNFDIAKFAGKWYELKYMVNGPISQKYALWDMSHYFNFDSNMDVTDNIYFRTKETHACLDGILKWKKTSRPGAYMEANRTLMVLDTDYSQYALLYKCIEQDADGRCTWAASRILSRTQDLPVSLEEQMFATLQDMCVKPNVYLTSRHKNECTPNDMDPSSARTLERSSLQIILVLLVVFLLK